MSVSEMSKLSSSGKSSGLQPIKQEKSEDFLSKYKTQNTQAVALSAHF